ncbi:hypothetical protein QTP88_025806 [Uroleucon formosanum]
MFHDVLIFVFSSYRFCISAKVSKVLTTKSKYKKKSYSSILLIYNVFSFKDNRNEKSITVTVLMKENRTLSKYYIYT